MAGRKTKLTPERQRTITDALERGHYARAACALAGIDESTYYRWLERGRKARRGRYRAFCEAVDQAEAKAENIAVLALQREVLRGDMRAVTFYLERRYPARWGRTVTELTGPEGGPVEFRGPLVIMQGTDPRRLPDPEE